ncbi:MAG: cell division protein FtsQ/DivIB [Methylococcaceae bacterium]
MKAVKAIVLIVLVLGIIWRNQGQLKTYGADAVPIKYVRTEGVFQYISKDEVKEVLMPLVMTGFFTADMQAIHQALAQMPWVASVSVKRVWPDAIDIKLREKKAYVRWGQNGLLTEKGELFIPKNIDQFQELPMVSGPESQQKKLLEIMKGINTALADQSMILAEFKVNDRWSWMLKLSNGMEIRLGHNEPLKKLQRFLKTLPLLGAEQVNAIAIADLRYTNGYAVSWKPEAAEIDWKKIVNPTHEITGQKNPI